jgi:hypothetical protein
MLYLFTFAALNLYLQMLRSLIIVICYSFCAVTLYAQSVFSGHVLENKTHITLHGVTVTNLNNKQKSVTGDDGRFSIAAKTGDLLELKTYSYEPDTVLLTDMLEKEIFLEPKKNMLRQVTISGNGAQTGVAEKNMVYHDPKFHGQTLVYHRDDTGGYTGAGGVIMHLHYFKADENKKKKEQQKEDQRILSEEISKVFTADNIGRYLPLKGADLTNFLLLYTPGVKVYNSKDFSLLAYLNTCYKTWLTLKPEQRKAAEVPFKKE